MGETYIHESFYSRLGNWRVSEQIKLHQEGKKETLCFVYIAVIIHYMADDKVFLDVACTYGGYLYCRVFYIVIVRFCQV